MSEVEDKTDTKSKFWMFTINNPLNNDFENVICEYMIWQTEMGENGTLHIQGYICFRERKRFSTVRLVFWENGEHKPHLEIRRGKHSEAKGYCSKKDTRLDGFYEIGDDRDIAEGKGARSDMVEIRNKLDKGIPEAQIWQENFSSYTRYYKSFREYARVQNKAKKVKEMKADFAPNKISLRLWQKSILEILPLQDNRKILWVIDEKGNTGKTFLANYLMANYNAFYSRGGKGVDIAHAYDYQDYVIFDYPREHEEFVNYSIIEQFKDGRIWSPKFDSELKITRSPKVICFSNFNPDQSKMSKDRWVIKRVD